RSLVFARVLGALHGHASKTGVSMRTGAVARLTAIVFALAVAIWLLPATVFIANWQGSGPTRIAFVPPLGRLWLTTAIVAGIVAALAAGWRATGRALDDLARALSPLALLLLWLVPFVPIVADRAPALLMFAGPMRWVVAFIAVFGVMRRLFVGWES